jgi:acid phosphatase family membrane protein YuiD
LSPSILLIIIMALLLSSPCSADTFPTTEEQSVDHPWLLRTSLVAGGVGLMMATDEGLQEWFTDHDTGGYETSSDMVRWIGEWPAFVSASVGLMAAGKAFNNEPVFVAGERVALSIAVSAVIEGAAKYTISRKRPTSADGWSDFEFFNTHSSMPSGHATVAFALAKSLSDDIDNGWASASLYSLAVLSSIARLVDNMHWMSDLGLGAAVGYASAELVSDRILAPAHTRTNNKTPDLVLTGLGPALAWKF